MQAEVEQQLGAKEHEAAELGAEPTGVRAELSEARADFAREEQAAARKDALPGERSRRLVESLTLSLSALIQTDNVTSRVNKAQCTTNLEA
tara:strand:+ start:166 stop:438 length:273 start_codon:yes stop_codon:yes gene_type:complete